MEIGSRRLDHLEDRPWTRRACFVVGVVAVPAVWVALRLTGARLVRGLMADNVSAATKIPVPFAMEDVERLGAIMTRAARTSRLPGTCLARALVLRRLLAHCGVPAQIVIGARPLKDRLDAHAWVEVAGHPVNEPADIARQYVPFRSPPAAMVMRFS
ncbi:MAG: lasso peptide biosynthesis B2 protein [Hyphomicrobiaceae bacterium]